MADAAGTDEANGYARDEEGPAERLDRNWAELLQELRVTLAGSQILAGFLLTIPFQSRFSELEAELVVFYLLLVGLATLSTVLSLAPVSLHRALFRRRERPRLVAAANVLLRVTFVALTLTLAGTALLIFGVVLGLAAGLAAGAVTLVLAASGWFALPLFLRRDRS